MASSKEEGSMSSEEMLNRSCSWTLACDNALLNRLKSFSENLSRNSEELVKECDTLSKDITHLDYKLRNVTNQFLMMSNNQFVENRVEEFEEFSSATSAITSSSKTKAEKEAELISKMKQAIQLGLKACDNKRQEGETASEKLYRIKRPFLIGSPKFFSSKYCGLVDESRRVATFESIPEDTYSLHSQNNGDILQPAAETKPIVTFTMPPPSVPVFPVPERNLDDSYMHNPKSDIDNRHIGIGKGVVPPSPTISDRSSDMGKPSSSASESRENVPRSVTDELNKIYASFAPPANADDDSDDDFRPSASAGRIFDDDDDDLFADKELFPPSQKNSDFFSRSNPSQLPAPPVFSGPPPVNPVPQTQPAFCNSARTLVGPSPKSNDIPNMSNVEEEGSAKDVSRNEATLPDADVGSGSARPKLPPGAVSMFGGMPPPLFHEKQAAPAAQTPTTKVMPVSSLSSKHSTQIGHSVTSSEPHPAKGIDSSGSSLFGNQGNVNTKWNASQSVVASAPPKRTDSISQNSLGSSHDLQRSNNKSVPASSLFDDSSDEDIFKSSKRQSSSQPVQQASKNIQPTPTFSSTITKPSTTSNIAPNPSTSAPVKREVQKKAPIKKSIFDESDSDDDLFASRPIKPAAKSKVETGGGGSKTKDIFKSAPISKPTAAIPRQTKSASLFGEDSDSDTDLFGNKKTVRPTPVSVQRKTEPEVKSIAKAPQPVVGVSNVKMDESRESSPFSFEKEPVLNVSTEEKASEVLTNNNNEDDESSEKSSEVVKSSSVESISNKDDHPPKSSEKPEPIKKSIFDDSDSDDDLFSSKKATTKMTKSGKSADDDDDIFNFNAPVVRKEPSPPVIPAPAPKVENAPPKPAEKVKAKPKVVSLFDDDSDSDSDLFTSKSKKSEEVKPKPKEKETAVKDDTSPSNDIVVKEKENECSKESEKAGDSGDKETSSSKKESTKPTKAVGSKISEKIKAMQTGTADGQKADATDVSQKPQIKSKVSVKNLALNLNINPLALKVGAKPPKPGGSAGSTPNTPEKDINDIVSSPTNDNSVSTSTDDTTTTDTPTKSTSASPKEDLGIEEILYDKIKDKSESDSADAGNDKAEGSSDLSKGDGGDHFIEIIKSRTKVQQKRRPPSKNFLKSRVIQEEPEPEVNEESTSESKTDETEDEKSTTENSISET